MGLFSWLSGNNEDEEDESVVNAHEFVQDCLADADKMREIKMKTGKNLREDMPVREIMEIQREIKLRSFGGRRN